MRRDYFFKVVCMFYFERDEAYIFSHNVYGKFCSTCTRILSQYLLGLVCNNCIYCHHKSLRVLVC